MSELTITVKDNSDEVLRILQDRVQVALEAVGLQAENYAANKCPVDTGLLRNSITHAVSGKAISKSYHASYGSNRNKKGKRYSASSKNAGSVGYGSYSGSIGTEADQCVYVGSNVEYAPYIEKGTQKTEPQPFLKPAFMDHVEEYKRLIKHVLET